MSVDLKELSKLLKSCKANGVTELKIGRIEIKFAQADATQIPVEQRIEIPVPPTGEQLIEAQETAAVQQNLRDAQDELAQMAIDDPATYEQLVIENELEPSGRQKTSLN